MSYSIISGTERIERFPQQPQFRDAIFAVLFGVHLIVFVVLFLVGLFIGTPPTSTQVLFCLFEKSLIRG